MSCFNNIPGNSINVETTIGHRTIYKEQFQIYYFAAATPERFVRCTVCHLKFHQICVLYCLFNTDPFTCDKCKEKVGIQAIHLRASTLPETECDAYINDFLKRQGINENDQMTIRLVTDVKHDLSVPEKFRKIRSGPSKIEYRNCSLFTFFDTGSNRDICFFSVFFQLFGEYCQDCNRNTAYLSYIDSVNFLPEHRTLIYRHILIGLFDFLRVKGYTKIYLWSCPPSGNQDYIFYVKPPKMKMPTAARLATWYRELLERGMELRVIDNYRQIQDAATDLSRLPYMDGDLWVTRLNEAIESVNKDRAKDCIDIKKLQTRLARQNRPEKMIEIQEQIEALRLKHMKGSDVKLWELMTVQIEGFNRQYFVIHMTATTKAAEVNFTKDKLLKSSSWLNDRHLFMDFFWGNILEFSSERRAQYSTFVMLWRIFIENKICASCRIQTGSEVSGHALCLSCHAKWLRLEKEEDLSMV